MTDWMSARMADWRHSCVQHGLRKTLYDEHLSHLKKTDDQIPYRDGDYFYYTRTVKGLSYGVRGLGLGFKV